MHLLAPPEVLDARYQDRRSISPVSELSSYAEVAADPTEANIGTLSRGDEVINTHRSTADDVEVRCAAFLGLLPRLDERLVDVIVGGEHAKAVTSPSTWHQSMRCWSESVVPMPATSFLSILPTRIGCCHQGPGQTKRPTSSSGLVH